MIPLAIEDIKTRLLLYCGDAKIIVKARRCVTQITCSVRCQLSKRVLFNKINFRRAANATNKIILNTLEEPQDSSSVTAVIVDKLKIFYIRRLTECAETER